MKKTFMGAALLALTLLSCGRQLVEKVDLIPQVDEVTIGKGSVSLAHLKTIRTAEGWEAPVGNFVRDVEKAMGTEMRLVEGEASIQLVKKEGLPAEGYTVDISRKGVTIAANDVQGACHGLTTLFQLMLGAAEGKLPVLSIQDQPVYGYRGLMLDCSRHFWTVDELKESIDQLAFFKFNTLHLHLTDNQAWRMAVDKYPELVKAGTHYPNYPELSDKYYTKDDLKAVVAYAASRGVEVIPEIDLPGHSTALLAALPELSCKGGKFEAYPEESSWAERKRAGENMVCVGNPKTYEFAADMVDALAEVFPSKYIHIGGDEAGKASWKTCPLCQRRMKKEGLKDVNELQSYLIRRIEKFLNANGRDLLGWDEILEGGLAPNATVMSWRGVEGGLKAIQSGHHAIMSPGGYCYLDSYQDAPDTQPEAIGGYLPLERVYSYEPVPDSFTVEEAKLLLGVQANLWTEYIPTEEHAEYMLYPRAIAVAEIGWTQPENKSWQSFRQRVLSDVLPKMQAKGYHPFDYSQEIGNRQEALQPVDHLAVGKKVEFLAPSWKNYPANGPETLTDGLRGGWNYSDGRWMAFVSDKRVDVVIDMEEETTVHSIGADFMQICGPGVFFPKKVIISVSTDGKDYQQLAEIDHEVVKDDAVSFKNYGWKGEAQARYIRYQSFPEEKYGGVHFVDEIVVE